MWVAKSVKVGIVVEETMIYFWFRDKIIIEPLNISTGKVKLTSKAVGIVGTTILLFIETVCKSYGLS